MFEVRFTPRGQKDLKKLPRDIQKRIINKLKFFITQSDPMVFSKALVDLPPATRRFRAGDYRIAFYVDKNTIYVERVRHRKEVYYLEIEI